VTSVSVIVQFLVALVGLGVAIDYSLLMIFRFREELGRGEDVDTAVVETMRHAGRSVLVSGSTVAIGLLSMVFIPIPVIRSIGLGGMLIPAVSVLRRSPCYLRSSSCSAIASTGCASCRTGSSPRPTAIQVLGGVGRASSSGIRCRSPRPAWHCWSC
jgi:hypothetical protein